ncbi:MAG TPA: hypothetical protein VI977_02285 [archaeon]|nr:hypothetical protein [archaeon]
MNRKILVMLVTIGIVVIAITLLSAIIAANNADKNCGSISDQSAKDDCYHSLAHETNDKNLCNNIFDSEKKEHCFGHIPE